jgi:hypothetical protein
MRKKRKRKTFAPYTLTFSPSKSQSFGMYKENVHEQPAPSIQTKERPTAASRNKNIYNNNKSKKKKNTPHS